MRYTAPAVFTAANADADAARIADRPYAASSVWIRSPEPMPRADITPARRPWAMLRARMYIVSGPGVSQRRKLAATKAQRSWIPNIRLLEQREIDRVAHRAVAQIARVEVVAAIVDRQHPGRMIGIA